MKLVPARDEKITTTISLPVSVQMKSKIEEMKIKIDVNEMVRQYFTQLIKEVEKLSEVS